MSKIRKGAIWILDLDLMVINVVEFETSHPKLGIDNLEYLIFVYGENIVNY